MTTTQAWLFKMLCWTPGGLLLLWASFALGQKPSEEGPELSLTSAIQIAVENNWSVKIARLDITKSQWQLAETKTKRLPQFTTALFASGDITSPTFTFQKDLFGPVLGSPVPAKNVSVNLAQGVTGYAEAKAAQPLSQLYKIHLAIREQELSVDLAGESYQGKRQSVVADVKQAYYAILQTESALDAAQAMVVQYQETDRLALQYLAQESVLKSESLDVKAKLAQAQYQIISLHNNLTTQKEHLNDLLGRDLDTPFHTQPVPPISNEEGDLQLARQTALRQRPEVKEAEIDVSRANYDRRLAKAQYIPDIGAAIRYFTPINTEILPQNIVSGGIEMSWDPFEWGGRKDAVKQKDITVQQSDYQLQQTRSKVLLDVDNTFRKLEESRSLLAVAQAARDASAEKLREVSDQFKKSVVLLRDLLQQQTAVANADHEYEESLLSFWNAKAEFEKALGEE